MNSKKKLKIPEKTFFLFGNNEKKAPKLKKTKTKKPKAEKPKNTKSKKTKDQEIKNPEISNEENEQMNQQPSTIDKELPKAVPDYVDEYQR